MCSQKYGSGTNLTLSPHINDFKIVFLGYSLTNELCSAQQKWLVSHEILSRKVGLVSGKMAK